MALGNREAGALAALVTAQLLPCHLGQVSWGCRGRAEPWSISRPLPHGFKPSWSLDFTLPLRGRVWVPVSPRTPRSGAAPCPRRASG